jgi:hypothetical protein
MQFVHAHSSHGPAHAALGQRPQSPGSKSHAGHAWQVHTHSRRASTATSQSMLCFTWKENFRGRLQHTRAKPLLRVIGSKSPDGDTEAAHKSHVLVDVTASTAVQKRAARVVTTKISWSAMRLQLQVIHTPVRTRTSMHDSASANRNWFSSVSSVRRMWRTR